MIKNDFDIQTIKKRKSKKRKSSELNVNLPKLSNALTRNVNVVEVLPHPFVNLGPVLLKDIAKAKHFSFKMKALNNSILKGKGNVAGFIGEFVFQRYLRDRLGLPVERDDKFDHDLMCGLTWLEIKTKQIYTKKFDAEYENAVCIKSTVQKGLYVFLRILWSEANKTGNVWFCGAFPTNIFKGNHNTIKREKGTKVGNWTVKETCYVRKIKDCFSMSELCSIIQMQLKVKPNNHLFFK